MTRMHDCLSRYVWLELPKSLNCHGGRIRWWQTSPLLPHGSSPTGNDNHWILFNALNLIIS